MALSFVGQKALGKASGSLGSMVSSSNAFTRSGVLNFGTGLFYFVSCHLPRSRTSSSCRWKATRLLQAGGTERAVRLCTRTIEYSQKQASSRLTHPALPKPALSCHVATLHVMTLPFPRVKLIFSLYASFFDSKPLFLIPYTW